MKPLAATSRSSASRTFPPEIVNATTAAAGAADAGERDRLVDALRRAGANRTEAARLLGIGIGRATLYRKLAFHGLAER